MKYEVYVLVIDAFGNYLASPKKNEQDREPFDRIFDKVSIPTKGKIEYKIEAFKELTDSDLDIQRAKATINNILIISEIDHNAIENLYEANALKS